MTRPAATPPPGPPPPCPLCRRIIDGADGPELITQFVAVTHAGLVNVPVHVGCFIDAIAGRVGDAVVEAMQRGSVSAGFDVEGGTMRDFVANMLGAVIHRYASG